MCWCSPPAARPLWHVLRVCPLPSCLPASLASPPPPPPSRLASRRATPYGHAAPPLSPAAIPAPLHRLPSIGSPPPGIMRATPRSCPAVTAFFVWSAAAPVHPRQPPRVAVGGATAVTRLPPPGPPVGHRHASRRRSRRAVLASAAAADGGGAAAGRPAPVAAAAAAAAAAVAGGEAVSAAAAAAAVAASPAGDADQDRRGGGDGGDVPGRSRGGDGGRERGSGDDGAPLPPATVQYTPPGGVAVRSPLSAVRVRHVLVATSEMVDGAWAHLASRPPYAAAAGGAGAGDADADGDEGGEGAFAAVAAALSTCPSAAVGGDVGWFPPGTMTPAFEAAAVGHPPGSVVKVATPFGWHLLRVTAHAAAASTATPAELGAALSATPPADDGGRAPAPATQVVDVRTAAEVAYAPLRASGGAGRGVRLVHLPLDDFDGWAAAWEADLAGLDAAAPVLVVGHYGVEAAGFAAFLTQAGCTDVRVVVGGVDAYAAEVDLTMPRYGGGDEEGEGEGEGEGDRGGGGEGEGPADGEARGEAEGGGEVGGERGKAGGG
ncbi:hypothetical protein I4F81_007190 [Pyropia yezoensis]|uniref:Uncharacterized protein n=1 Tax=Pyropia yezoensis TaxID=2788 RepID=A0ACC3C2Y1_PYRYE|nr:hypothetical protein I4F81_007190 [Neopyropia yezoensis]